MVQQRPGTQWIKDDGDFCSCNFPAAQAPGGGLGGLLADLLRRLHLTAMSCGRHPMIALHPFLRLSDWHTVQSGTGPFIGAVETQCVCQRYLASRVLEGSAFRIRNSLIRCKGS